MMGHSSLILLAAFAMVLPHGAAGAGTRIPFKANMRTPVIEAVPTLALFQHIRFCLQYPDDCRSNSPESERVDLTSESLELLRRVNHRVNVSIVSKSKAYGSSLEDRWTIAPDRGDCNDYAVTKRHELLRSGLPSSALRLSVTKTATGTGHLVLVVVTTKGNLVMDSLADAIRPWQSTDYEWLKIQSARDPHYWVEIRSPVAAPAGSLFSLASKKASLLNGRGGRADHEGITE
jgi:predicted transglutaminase-like cysteine proteinase